MTESENTSAPFFFFKRDDKLNSSSSFSSKHWQGTGLHGISWPDLISSRWSQDDQWQGLPLMSWPPSGRETHHETRVMRDDVMCHGTRVSRALEILDVPGLDQKAASKY